MHRVHGERLCPIQGSQNKPQQSFQMHDYVGSAALPVLSKPNWLLLPNLVWRVPSTALFQSLIGILFVCLVTTPAMMVHLHLPNSASNLASNQRVSNPSCLLQCIIETVFHGHQNLGRSRHSNHSSANKGKFATSFCRTSNCPCLFDFELLSQFTEHAATHLHKSLAMKSRSST